MYSTACTRFSKVSGLVISLAVIAAGNPVFAEGVIAACKAVNLQVLQNFFPDVRGAGRATLMAAIDGPLAG